MPHELIILKWVIVFFIVMCFCLAVTVGLLLREIASKKNAKVEPKKAPQEPYRIEKIYFGGMVKVIDTGVEIKAENTEAGRSLILSFKTVETAVAFLYGFVTSYEQEATVNIYGRGLQFDARQSIAFQQSILAISQHINHLITSQKGDTHGIRSGDGSSPDMESAQT